MPRPAHPPWFNRPNNITFTVNIVQLFIMKLLQLPITSSLSYPNICTRILLSNIINLYSSLSARDRGPATKVKETITIKSSFISEAFPVQVERATFKQPNKFYCHFIKAATSHTILCNISPLNFPIIFDSINSMFTASASQWRTTNQ